MMKTAVFGMRRMPGLVRAAVLAAAAGMTLGAAPAAAGEFCAGLRQALAHAAGSFRTLAIAGERTIAGAVPARNLLPDANRCDVRGDRDVVEYRCRMTPADASPASVRAAYRRSVAHVRRCFAGILPRGVGDYTGAVEWTGAVVWEPRPGLRAAVVFVADDVIALAADNGAEPPEETNAAWVVVDTRRR